MDITIYHNTRCGTSRTTLALIRNTGVEPNVIEYLHNPPTREELAAIIDKAGISVRDAVRQKETLFKELGLDDPAVTDSRLLDAMIEYPILINRPFVITSKGVRLCRPSEQVLEILPLPQKGALNREDGTPLIDALGQKVMQA
ncbi:arsenate reductase (glutaredoxin) [Advenella sp. S44]|uniref:arsenate reductase (glutaredoxin) n=1 Tax=Advenella sp. S44 TaxID=1982755 RepID=UPI000C2ACF48|nr:arsenate reductase (glutaredoxin) [Advenella sp. S44]PJX20959.1 arsenate reductase (glutaredoxin) [Advenella sp. S44]